MHYLFRFAISGFLCISFLSFADSDGRLEEIYLSPILNLSINNNYYAVPPYLESLKRPNVLIVLQDDARMRWRAYYSKDPTKNAYNPDKTYLGFFNPNLCYKWNKSGHYWEVSTEDDCYKNTPNISIGKFPIIEEKFQANSTEYKLKYSPLTLSQHYMGKNIDNFERLGGILIPEIKFKDKGDKWFLVYSSYQNNKCKLYRIEIPNGNSAEEIGSCEDNILNFCKDSSGNNCSKPTTDFTVYYVPVFEKDKSYSGNFLNWFYTSRLDFVRLVFTGGSLITCPKNEGSTSAQSYSTKDFCDYRYINSDDYFIQTQDVENWDLYYSVSTHLTNDVNGKHKIFYYTFPGVPIKVSKYWFQINGLLYSLSNSPEEKRPRIGLMIYDTANPVVHPWKVYIGDYDPNGQKPDKPYANLITALNSHRDLHSRDNAYNSPYYHYANIWDAGNSLAPALWEAYRYFKQEDPYCGGFMPGGDSEPKKNPWYQEIPKGAWCNNTLKTNNFCKVSDVENYLIVITEGLWNIGFNSSGNLIKTCSIDDGYGIYSSDPVVPIYHMYKEGFIKKVFVINFYPYGKEGEIASKVMAIFGGFDKNREYPYGFNGFPSNICDLSNYNEDLKSCKGSLCVDEKFFTTFAGNRDWDKNGDGIPDNYYSAEDLNQLSEAVSSIFGNILSAVVGGGSLGIQTSQKKVKGGALSVSHGVALQNIVYPYRTFPEGGNTKWVSSSYIWWLYVEGNQTNLREDTNLNKILDIDTDRILEWNGTSIDMKINVYSVNENGTKRALVKIAKSYDELNPIADLGEILKNTPASNRKIYTAIFKLNENPSDEYGGQIEFSQDIIEDKIADIYENDKTSFWRISLNCLAKTGYWIKNCSDENKPLNCILDKYIECAKANLNIGKLINWERGIDYPELRIRKTDGEFPPESGTEKNVWKLGDITYSSPLIVDYGKYKVAYIGSNDGMLHAFRLGYIKQKEDSKHPIALVNEKQSTNSDLVGEELWAFVPQDVIPYINILASTSYRHIYTVDLTPFVFDLIDKDGNKHKILIAGLRLGGATAIDDDMAVHPPEYTCSTSLLELFYKYIPGLSKLGNISKPTPDYSKCFGLSEYFALDITDPENPIFLWYFKPPDLGFSFSGPAIVKKKLGKGYQYYVVFVNGPANYKGVYKDESNVKLKAFVLKLKSEGSEIGKLEQIDDTDKYYITIETDIKKAFGGRLFNFGYDWNNDGNTDYVIFGYTKLDSFDTTTYEENAHGGIAFLDTRKENPKNWSISTYELNGMSPVTSKVLVGKCFKRDYIFFGTGKWFFRVENPLSGQKERLYGVPINCDTEGNCEPSQNIKDVTQESNAQNICLEWSGYPGWYLELTNSPLADKYCGHYISERVISDPSLSNNVVFFASTIPCNDVNGKLAAKGRLYALNCALGTPIGFRPETCVKKKLAKLDEKVIQYQVVLLQTSSGKIYKTNLNKNCQTTTLLQFLGAPPESGVSLFNSHPQNEKGILLFWLEY